jgi:hypothetical protein
MMRNDHATDQTSGHGNEDVAIIHLAPLVTPRRPLETVALVVGDVVTAPAFGQALTALWRTVLILASVIAVLVVVAVAILLWHLLSERAATQ